MLLWRLERSRVGCVGRAIGIKVNVSVELVVHVVENLLIMLHIMNMTMSIVRMSERVALDAIGMGTTIIGILAAAAGSLG